MRNPSDYYFNGSAESKTDLWGDCCWQWLENFVKEHVDTELHSLSGERGWRIQYGARKTN